MTNSKTKGTIVKQERKSMWQVQFGNIKMTVNEHDLTPIGKSEKNYTPSITIDLADPETIQQNFSNFAPSLQGLPTNRPVFELRLIARILKARGTPPRVCPQKRKPTLTQTTLSLSRNAGVSGTTSRCTRLNAGFCT